MSTILANQDPIGYTPDVDGAVLTQSIKTALARGQFQHVPVIIGTNHDEYRLFVAVIQLLGGQVTAANYQEMIASTLGDRGEEADDKFLADGRDLLRRHALTAPPITAMVCS